MMLYQIKYELNGTEGSKTVRASSQEDALRRFKEQWEEYGDEAPDNPWIDAVWAERV